MAEARRKEIIPMKKNVVALCSIVLLVLLPTFSAVLFASDPTPQNPYLDKIEQEEKKHVGEKVILLRGSIPEPPHPLPDELWVANMSDTPSKAITDQEWAAKFFGKTGTVTGVERFSYWSDHGGRQQDLKYIVTLDTTGERIGIVYWYWIMIFQSNFEMAKRNVGRTFWAKGQKDVVVKESSSWPLPAGRKEAEAVLEKAPKLKVLNTHMLTLTNLELGGGPALGGGGAINIFPCFTLADGRNVCAPRMDATKFSESDWLFEDPRPKHPKWHKGIWELIEKQEIAIGMTIDMVELVCSQGVHKRGPVLSLTSPDELGIIATCYGIPSPDFLLQGGKVVKFVK
jgi:hypothetical protein